MNQNCKYKKFKLKSNKSVDNKNKSNQIDDFSVLSFFLFGDQSLI